MGRNRAEYKDKTTSKVCKQLIGKINKKELYEVWKTYNELKIKGISILDCIEALYGEDLNFFTALGFEIINEEYIKELVNDKC
ncbi:MAG: hypothetical protein PHF86_08450 [Candidatus Nanoarchaeia archaeon]|jgi:hypothetical protein|nr:hypothetical protein [Candidatus Nanoarchaeia archaeon]